MADEENAAPEQQAEATAPPAEETAPPPTEEKIVAGGTGPAPANPNPTGLWKHGICGCFENCGICIVTYFLPCYTFGKNMEAMGESCIICCLCYESGLDAWAHTAMRTKLRHIRGINGSILGDALMVLCCRPCAIVQEAGEIKHMQAGNMARD